MKNFTTISEKELLHAAYDTILSRWVKHIEHNEKYQKEHGIRSEIDKHWIGVYEKQLDELHAEIVRLEQAAI